METLINGQPGEPGGDRLREGDVQMSDRWVKKSRCSAAFALVFAPSRSSSTPEEEEKVAKNEDFDRSTFLIKIPFKKCIS